MNTLRQSVAVLFLAGVGLAGCAYDSHSGSDLHPTTVADLQAVLRDEWSRHLFWTRNVVLDNAKKDFRSKSFSEKAVANNTREIARTFRSFYGEATSDQLRTLLTKHYEAVRAYSDATVAGNALQQDSAMTQLTSNTDDIAAFLSKVNPYLSKGTVRDLFATLVDHHVTQITKIQTRDYAGEEATWPAMEHHAYLIADTLATALGKQFPSQFL